MVDRHCPFSSTHDRPVVCRARSGALGSCGIKSRTHSAQISQYLTTAEWVLEALCAAYPEEPVALYAGGAASFVQRGQDRRTAQREQIKTRIQNGEIRLVCATDAACEGLNLQRLGAQVNIDMPWNPSRLEQRKGRVQRIGQVRDDVHMLNLRYAGTVEDQSTRRCPAVSGTSFRCSVSFPIRSRMIGLMPS